MTKDIIKSVVVAIVVAAILGLASGFSGAAVIRWMGGVTKEEFKSASLGDLKVVTASATAAIGQDSPVEMGLHRACFLTTTQDENNAPGGAAICSIKKDGEKWTLTAHGSRCVATCID